VPLVSPFQATLAPVLFVVFLLTVFKIQWGVLFFIFAFPLINNLPYFFGLYENIPHAPVALVLFLFFFLGWLVHNAIFKPDISLKHNILIPIILFSAFLVVSGLITFFRYANFYPFLSDHVYELVANVNGVTAGGAIMSTVFFSLNYLTGFVFFFILLNTIKSEEFLKKILVVLLISTIMAVGFGLYQHFIDLKFGNNIRSFGQGLVSATFKDAISFGCFLALIIPVLLSIFLAFKGVIRILSGLAIISTALILPHVGSKSALIALVISLLLFVLYWLKINWRKFNLASGRRVLSLGAILVLTACMITILLVSFPHSRTSERLRTVVNRYKKGDIEKILGRRLTYRWKMAAYMIEDYPLTGIGTGAFIIESSNYSEIKSVRFRRAESAENYFLQVGSELGIIGLFFSLWIFWEIFKQIKRSLGKYSPDDRWRYIQIGISCGTISIFLIILVHTFIGSYEIKYTFWLLVALIFCLSRSEKEPGEKLHFSKGFKILSLVLIVVFGAVHLWNSTHSLSLKSRTEKLGLKQDFGLYQEEKTDDGREFRWTGSYGGQTIKIEKSVIEIPLLASHPNIEKNPVEVKIYLIKDFFREKKLLDEIILTESIWKTYEYDIPEEVNQEVILLIKVSRTWNPLKITGAPDPRNLGVAVGKIQFKENEIKSEQQGDLKKVI